MREQIVNARRIMNELWFRAGLFSAGLTEANEEVNPSVDFDNEATRSRVDPVIARITALSKIVPRDGNSFASVLLYGIHGNNNDGLKDLFVDISYQNRNDIKLTAMQHAGILSQTYNTAEDSVRMQPLLRPNATNITAVERLKMEKNDTAAKDVINDLVVALAGERAGEFVLNEFKKSTGQIAGRGLGA